MKDYVITWYNENIDAQIRVKLKATSFENAFKTAILFMKKCNENGIKCHLTKIEEL